MKSEIDNSHYQPYLGHSKYGNMILVCSKTDYFMLGPHYWIFLPTLLILTSLLFLLLVKSIDQLTYTWFLIVLIAILFFFLSYLCVGFSNPGIVLNDNQYWQNKTGNVCHICRITKTDGTSHCNQCDVCIAQLDHHCPWIGKCVGSGNKQKFYVFLAMTCGVIVIFMAGSIASRSYLYSFD